MSINDENVREASAEESARIEEVVRQVFGVFERSGATHQEAAAATAAVLCRLALASANMTRERFVEHLGSAWDFYANAHRRGAN